MSLENQETLNNDKYQLLSLLMEELCQEVERLQPWFSLTSLRGDKVYLPVDDIESIKATYRDIANATPCSLTCRCAEQANSIIAQLETNPERIYVMKIQNQYLEFPPSALETLKADLQGFKAWATDRPKAATVPGADSDH
jgi:hypothetical protein